MARFGLYSGINEGTIKTNAENIKNNLKSEKTKLESYKSSLTDSIWKADSKTTFLDGINKTSSEVYKEADSNLDVLINVCDIISKYKDSERKYHEAESHAKRCIIIINSEDPDDYRSVQAAENARRDLNTYRSQMRTYERMMEECESQITSICGG